MIKDKVVLITGAGSGIGKVTAHKFAAEGAKVVCADIKNAEKTADEIQKEGGTSIGISLDVSKLNSWNEAKEKIIKEFNSIDVLCNIAGISEAVDIVDLDEDDFDNLININLKGPYLGMKVILPELLKKGSGKIVNIASLAAHIGLPGLPSYSASKGGVASMTRQAAVEYAPKNIQINAVSPGIIETPILATNPPEVTKQFTDATPAGRLGKPEDIANMVLYLSSDKSDFISGEIIKVDGGWSAQ
ncbi:SDR family NAD(P)-dependent oxidoreductase [Pseudogracilibacillus sp. SO30301A]|uniref:SDR family NAD(P)-dependent oxidoreductase n=1 Tax=Pseudogracilibacillus sp. SO30301A TaxID=3098291 RepID=UPI00300DFFB9